MEVCIRVLRSASLTISLWFTFHYYDKRIQIIHILRKVLRESVNKRDRKKERERKREREREREREGDRERNHR